MMLVSLNLQPIRNSVEESQNQSQHGPDSRVIHDEKVLAKVFVGVMNDTGVDVVSDRSESLLVAVGILSGAWIGFKGTEDDGVNHGESSRGEEALSCSENQEIRVSATTRQDRECHGTHKHRVHNHTKRRNQLILSRAIRQSSPIHGTQKVEDLQEHGKVQLGLAEAPHRSNELENVGMGRVDQPVEEKVKRLGDNKEGIRVHISFRKFTFVSQLHCSNNGNLCAPMCCFKLASG